MDEQSNIPYVPDMVWDRSHGSGLWLNFFTDTLIDLLPNGYFFNDEERNAVTAMCQAADYFIVPLNKPIDNNRESWSGHVSAAADASFGSLTLKEFRNYVANGRKSAMSFKDVVQCITKNKRSLFGFGADHDLENSGVNQVLAYLKRLRDLRIAVKKVISFLDIDKPRTVKNFWTGKTYQLNLRKLYEEFKSHYAYETALYIPMY